VVFSPGNVTNACFYSALLEELASHGYVVIAMDHPFDVAAVLLRDGRTVGFAGERWPPLVPSAPGTGDDAHARFYRQRVEERARDAAFVLNQLEAMNGEAGGRLGSRLDLTRVGIFGHSVGGVAAAHACQLDRRFKACLNMDGLTAGRPFYLDAGAAGLERPFMLLVKATSATVSDATLRTAMSSVKGGGYQVTIGGARHEDFGDGPTLLPTPFNPRAAEADEITQVVRDYARTFFDRALGRSDVPLTAPWPAHPRAVVATYPPQ
jgi:hypothetical protein